MTWKFFCPCILSTLPKTMYTPQINTFIQSTQLNTFINIHPPYTKYLCYSPSSNHNLPNSIMEWSQIREVYYHLCFPSSALKKKHQACNYHKVRESIAAGFIKYGHIRSEENVADLLTKPLPRTVFERLCSHYIFRRPKSVQGKENKDDNKLP